MKQPDFFDNQRVQPGRARLFRFTETYGNSVPQIPPVASRQVRPLRRVPVPHAAAAAAGDARRASHGGYCCEVLNDAKEYGYSNEETKRLQTAATSGICRPSELHERVAC